MIGRRANLIEKADKAMQIDDLVIDIEQHIEIKAPIGDVWKTVLHRISEGMAGGDGKSMQMHLEPWAGGRWYRDRGEGIGHLWGFVQTIKPPVLIELTGPMFMSAPVLNYIEFKLTPAAVGVDLQLRQKSIGLIEPSFRNVREGWGEMMKQMKEECESAKA